MNNLVYNFRKIESIRSEFLNKGFSEEAIDFVLLHNENHNFEVLKERINSLEQQIINVEKSLQKDISNLHSKIDNVEKSLNEKLSMGNRLIHFMIIAAAILGPFIHSFLIQYMQGSK
ncbi:Bdr family repetitive protein [Borreliella tanukii]|uniref:Bdr family repetitive protein n=1 Tax=Borreliella tanukii TaxID=56146 RepID=UPI003AB932D4